MAKNIFNENYGVDTPTLLLQNRNFETIGSINNVFGFTYKENYNSANELSFSIYKKIDGYENYLWDSIIDFKIIYIPEFKERFEINTSVISNDSTVKSVTATSLCESELSQTMLYDIEINTENDILNADYDENFPTIFYRDPESFHNYDWSDDKYKDYTDDKKKEILRHSSLLHRILEKAEHYSIGTVANSLKSLNIIREFSISDTDIYSVLTGEIADEFNCIFLFDSMTRTLSAYDLYNTCTNCNYRGDFSDKCPECGSKEFGGQYGKDTTVFISTENLAQEISLETNKDSLKNCFYVEGGDDIITSTIRSINPNGTNYIYEYNDDTKEDMPEELSSTIDAYDKLYQEYFTQKVFPLDPTSVENYNKVVQEINQLFKEDDSIGFSKIGQNLIGYSSVIESIYEATDLYQFLQNSMMPTINIDGLGLEESLQNIITGFSEGFSVINDNGSITTYFQNQISLMDYTTATQSSVENAIKKSARLYYSRAYYDLDINTLSYERATDSKNGTWKGTFTLTSLTETNDNGVKLSETSDIITLEINNNIELYIEQSIYRAVTDIEKSKYGEITSLKMDFDTFKEKISLYSFSELERLKESFQACLNIIIAANIFDEELKEKYYDFYKERFDYIDLKELPKREEQIKNIQALYFFDSSTYETSGILYDIKKEVNRILNFKDYLISNPLNYDSYNGEQLWKTFCAYRREDKYTNSNYISDGLTNAKIIENTKQLFDAAKKELYKASHLQLTLSANLNNLLVLEEFQPLVDSFSCGNWIRVGIDEKIYKLRLLSYQINFDDIPSIEVEFSTVEKLWSGDSDVKSILDSAKSIASSYSYTVQQVNNSSKSSKYVENWVEKGLDATATKLVNSANNQDIVIDRNGILCRKYDDINDIYDLCQTKIVSNGIYTTDDGWETVSTGIGKICYIDPESGKEVIDYGVIAKTVIGKLFLGENLSIYNTNGSLRFDGNGLCISNNENTISINPNDNEKLIKVTNYAGEDVFYTTNNGKIYTKNGDFSGRIETTSGKIAGFNIDRNGIYNSDNSIHIYSSGRIIHIGGRWEITQTEIYKFQVEIGSGYLDLRTDGDYSYETDPFGRVSIHASGITFYIDSSKPWLSIENACKKFFLYGDMKITKSLELNQIKSIGDYIDVTGNIEVSGNISASSFNGFTLEKSVPANAVFTDTNTWRGIQNNLTSDSTTDSLSAAQGKLLKSEIDNKYFTLANVINGKADSYHEHTEYLSINGGFISSSIFVKEYLDSVSNDLRFRVITSIPETNKGGRLCTYINTNTLNSSGTYYITVNGGWSSDVMNNDEATTTESHNIVSASSDVRLKENVKDTTIEAIPTIMKIRMRQFDWKDKDAHQKIGFIADELEEIDKHFAFGGGYEENGAINVKSVDTFYMQGYIVKAIQELVEENNLLKEQLNTILQKLEVIE